MKSLELRKTTGRLLRLIEDLSARRLAEMGADGVKILLYYDVDEDDAINDLKKAMVERASVANVKAKEFHIL